jgi:hypothetical protein
MCPTNEGKPIFTERLLFRAWLQGDTLAVAGFETTGQTRKQHETLWLFKGPGGAMLHRFADLVPDGSVALSADGRYVARRVGRVQVRINESDSGRTVCQTVKGKSHQRQVELLLSDHRMQINVGRWYHFLRWSTGELTYHHTQDATNSLFVEKQPPLATRKIYLPECTQYDPIRFVTGQQAGLIAVVDRFGQVAVFDRTQLLLCMFFVFRDSLAGWMPDGTCFGPKEIIGTIELKTARHRFGQVLKAASEQQGAPT